LPVHFSRSPLINHHEHSCPTNIGTRWLPTTFSEKAWQHTKIPGLFIHKRYFILHRIPSGNVSSHGCRFTA